MKIKISRPRIQSTNKRMARIIIRVFVILFEDGQIIETLIIKKTFTLF